MRKLTRHLSTIMVIFVLTIFCASVIHAASPDKARDILGKTYDKYSGLLKKDGKKIESVAAKIKVKGGGELPMGDGGAPLNIDAVLEVYFKQPHNLYLALSGNLGSAIFIVSGEDKKVGTVILPTTNQFARIDIPEEVMEKTEVEEDEEMPKIDDLLKDAELSYEGTEKLELGKAHKIKISSKDPKDEGSATVYILDKKWDPVQIDVKGDEGGVSIDFGEVKINSKVSKKQFIPDTAKLSEITQDQLTTVIMMQIMGAMMQQSGGGGM